MYACSRCSKALDTDEVFYDCPGGFSYDYTTPLCEPCFDTQRASRQGTLDLRGELFTAPVTVTDPVLPYGGTSGHSGSDTSRERAEREDSDGTTSFRQRRTLALLADAGYYGLTWVDLGERLDVHHGAASGVLSTLHKAGAIARLTIRRGRCQVYVLHEYVADRPLAPYKPNTSTRQLRTILEELLDDISAGRVTTARARIAATLQELGE